MDATRSQRLAQFVEWCRRHITGDEKSHAQIFLDRLLQAFGQKGCLEVAGDPDAGNLRVQGDNLLALKALLPCYAGKVTCHGAY